MCVFVCVCVGAGQGTRHTWLDVGSGFDYTRVRKAHAITSDGSVCYHLSPSFQLRFVWMLFKKRFAANWSREGTNCYNERAVGTTISSLVVAILYYHKIMLYSNALKWLMEVEPVLYQSRFLLPSNSSLLSFVPLFLLAPLLKLWLTFSLAACLTALDVMAGGQALIDMMGFLKV